MPFESRYVVCSSLASWKKSTPLRHNKKEWTTWLLRILVVKSAPVYIVSFWKCCSSTLRVRVALRDGEHCAWRSKAGWQAGLARVSCLRQKFTSTTTHKVFAFVEYTRGIFFCGWGIMPCLSIVNEFDLTSLRLVWLCKITSSN